MNNIKLAGEKLRVKQKAFVDELIGSYHRKEDERFRKKLASLTSAYKKAWRKLGVH